MATATVFWLTVSANQRGLPKALHGPLLEQLISNAPSSFYKENTQYDNDFTSIHDKIQTFFIKKATKLMDGFLESPAGVTYLEMYESIRCVLHLVPGDLI